MSPALSEVPMNESSQYDVYPMNNHKINDSVIHAKECYGNDCDTTLLVGGTRPI